MPWAAKTSATSVGEGGAVQAAVTKEVLNQPRRLVDQHHAGFFCELHEGVRDPTGREDHVPRPELHVHAPDHEAIAALDPIEDLVLVSVHVHRGPAIGALAKLLQDRHAAIGVGARDLHVQGVGGHASHAKVGAGAGLACLDLEAAWGHVTSSFFAGS